MKIVKSNILCYIDLNFSDLELFGESWTKGDTFSNFENKPRTCCAFFVICGDIQVTFYPLDGKPVLASKGDLVWIPKGAQYKAKAHGKTDERISSYTVNFNIFNSSGEQLLLADCITVLSHKQYPNLKHHIELLNERIHGAEKRNQLMIKSEFYSLLNTIAQGENDNNSYLYPIRIGAQALKKEWNLNRSIDEYAQMSGVSKTYFYRCFRRWSGKSPVEYRNMTRLSNAEVMLCNTGMKIKDISAAVGFEDPFYFCRLFSENFGTSPKNYRKSFGK